MKQSKKIAAIVLAAACAFTMLAPTSAYAAKKKKKTYVTREYALKQIEGKLGATVASAGAISVVKDVKKKDKLYKTMSVALNAGLITPNKAGKLNPKTKATKNYVAGVIAKIAEKDKSKVSGNGSSTKFTKSSLKTYLNKQFPNVISKDNAKIKKGTVVVNAPLTIKDKTITGDLIIGDGVGEKEVTLDNVTVKGRMIVRGGGEHSIYIIGSSSIGQIIVKQVNNKVSIKIRDAADVKFIYINDGSNDVNVEGTVGEVTVAGKAINVSLTNATVGKATIAESAKGATITADSKSTVKEVSLDAEGSKIDGEGKIDKVAVNANDTSVLVDTTIEKKEGVSDPVTKTTGTTENTDNNNNNNNGTSEQGNTSTGTDTTANTTTTDTSTSSSTSDSSSYSGGSSYSGYDGGSSSDSGSSSSQDNTEITYNTDNRFAKGYPAVGINKSSGDDVSQRAITVTVAFKLADNVNVSEELPAKITYALSFAEANMPANTAAVLNGRLGYGANSITIPEKHDELTITDHDEHTIEFEYNGNNIAGLVLYSVINANGVISQTPNKVYFDRDTVEGTAINDINPRNQWAYLNKAQNRLTVYFYANLDKTSVPSTDSFTILSNGEQDDSIKVTDVTISDFDERFDGDYVDITLNKAVNPQDKLTLIYREPVANPFKDQSGNKVISSEWTVMQTTDTVTSVVTDKNKNYVAVTLPASNLRTHSTGSNLELQCFDSSDTNTAFDNADSMGSCDYMTYYFKSSKPFSSLVLKTSDGKPFVNAAGDPIDISTFATQNETVFTLGKAEYDGTYLKLYLDNTEGYLATRDYIDGNKFELTVDGKKYTPKNGVYIYKNESKVYIEFSTDSNLSGIDLDNANNVSIQYTAKDWNSAEYGSAGAFLVYDSGRPYLDGKPSVTPIKVELPKKNQESTTGEDTKSDTSADPETSETGSDETKTETETGKDSGTTEPGKDTETSDETSDAGTPSEDNGNTEESTEGQDPTKTQEETGSTNEGAKEEHGSGIVTKQP